MGASKRSFLIQVEAEHVHPLDAIVMVQRLRRGVRAWDATETVEELQNELAKARRRIAQLEAQLAGSAHEITPAE